MKINEIITEESQFPQSHIDATPGMRTHATLANSDAYAPWRFAAHFLGGAGDPSGEYEHQPEKVGPTGQSLITVAYSEGEHAILDQAEKAFGVTTARVTSDKSRETQEIHRVSPVAPRKKNKHGV